MHTPFDELVDDVKACGFHNHRLEDHSDTVSRGILRDLIQQCEALRADVEGKKVAHWLNVRAPGARQRKIDLLLGEAKSDSTPDLERVRLCIENKSVVTAHRNRDARFDDLNEALQVLHRVRAEAVVVATVLIGVADRVLNVRDKVKASFRGKGNRFEKRILPRLSSGDAKLWEEFAWAVSTNRRDDAAATVAKFRQLPTRSPGLTHVVGYDYVLLVPIHIDNVNPPYLPRPNALGIDVDREYQMMLDRICKAYSARWHL